MSGPFRRRTVVWLAAGASLSFALGLLLSVFEGEVQQVRSVNADTFSYSALGHRAWLDVLARLGRPVMVSRDTRRHGFGDSSLLVVAEPDLSQVSSAEDRLDDMLDRAPRALVILPKWRGVRDATQPRWVTSVTPVPAHEIDDVLDALGADAELVRLRPGSRTTGWSTGLLKAAPEIDAAQLLGHGGDFETLVWCDQGVLVARLPGTARDVVLLSDPDLVANHALGRGGNAVAAVELAGIGGEPGDAVVFDETLHGHELVRTLWRELFSFPLVLGGLHAALAVALFVWAGMVRFGPPRATAPILEAGRQTLIENTAELLEFGGHTGHTLSRYFQRAVEDVVTAHPIGEGEADARHLALAQQISERRGVEVDLAALDEGVRRLPATSRRPRRAESRRLLAIAQRIHDWREEVLDGAHRDR